MRDDNARIALLGLIVVFSGIVWISRKKIAYPFCTLERYTGKINRGKASYFFLFHLVVSLALTLVFYSLLTNIKKINGLFDDTVVRLSCISLLWLICAWGIGLFIEAYLEYTDKEYRQWKMKRTNK